MIFFFRSCRCCAQLGLPLFSWAVKRDTRKQPSLSGLHPSLGFKLKKQQEPHNPTGSNLGEVLERSSAKVGFGKPFLNGQNAFVTSNRRKQRKHASALSCKATLTNTDKQTNQPSRQQ